MTITINAKQLRAEAWWQQIEGSPRLRCEWIGASRAEKARRAFFRHRDEDYSCTHCTSLVVIQELKLNQALTTDGHFRRMGFEAVPGPPS
jgi:predicted nucleic acid-binding protein